ncbi:hypothetical protein LIER_00203 [Lithospermum erythrorhizon]|uniref:Uncharacterized protein n=1 Tax=Lithospermum erythrorhizon TaxID=34254 RepID=A0AAV3NIZ4_LITER
MLVDGGSAVNILPFQTLKLLGVSTEDLQQSRIIIQALQEAEEDLVQAFKGLTLLLTQHEKVVTSPLKGFVTPRKGPKIEHGTMGPKAYDLLLKAGYDPAKDKVMGQLPPEATRMVCQEPNHLPRPQAIKFMG